MLFAVLRPSAYWIIILFLYIFSSASDFGEKIENFSKIILREIISAVNLLEQIQKTFFFKFEIWVNLFKKTLRTTLPQTLVS